LTGRDNYRAASQALGIDLLKNPDLAARPDIAAEIAIWYWFERVRPGVMDFANTVAVTKRINPALAGIEDRHENFKYYLKYMR
jgi:putative chitinase